MAPMAPMGNCNSAKELVENGPARLSVADSPLPLMLTPLTMGNFNHRETTRQSDAPFPPTRWGPNLRILALSILTSQDGDAFSTLDFFSQPARD